MRATGNSAAGRPWKRAPAASHDSRGTCFGGDTCTPAGPIGSQRDKHGRPIPHHFNGGTVAAVASYTQWRLHQRQDTAHPERVVTPPRPWRESVSGSPGVGHPSTLSSEHQCIIVPSKLQTRSVTCGVAWPYNCAAHDTNLEAAEGAGLRRSELALLDDNAEHLRPSTTTPWPSG